MRYARGLIVNLILRAALAHKKTQLKLRGGMNIPDVVHAGRSLAFFFRFAGGDTQREPKELENFKLTQNSNSEMAPPQSWTMVVKLMLHSVASRLRPRQVLLNFGATGTIANQWGQAQPAGRSR